MSGVWLAIAIFIIISIMVSCIYRYCKNKLAVGNAEIENNRASCLIERELVIASTVLESELLDDSVLKELAPPTGDSEPEDYITIV